MGLLAVLRRHRRAGLVPVLAWILLQAVMATGVRAAAGAPGADADALFLRDLATSICLAGQPDDGQPGLPSLQDRCSWCAAFAQAALPPPASGISPAAVAFPQAAAIAAPDETPPERLRYVLAVTRAPPA